MKKLLFSGWNFRRVIYLIGGIFIVIQAVVEKQWFLLIPGIYFASMGFFAFGCASGNCYTGYQRPKANAPAVETSYEEIKNKA